MNIRTKEEAIKEFDIMIDKKCDLCKKKLKHNEKVTELVYCNRCNGIYCLECWYIQRGIEERND